MRKCLTPLIPLTDCTGRLAINLGDCNCSNEITHLVITQGGCDTYQEVVHYKECEPRGWGCCPNVCIPQVVVETVPVPKASITYPLHEMDCDGNAVFVLDGKLGQLGYGRYHAKILHEKCCVMEFDIDYHCAGGFIQSISTEKARAMGERC